MSSKIYDLEDLIDIREYVRKKGAEQKRRGEDSGRNHSSSCVCNCTFKISRTVRQKDGGDIQAICRKRGRWRGWDYCGIVLTVIEHIICILSIAIMRKPAYNVI